MLAPLPSPCLQTCPRWWQSRAAVQAASQQASCERCGHVLQLVLASLLPPLLCHPASPLLDATVVQCTDRSPLPSPPLQGGKTPGIIFSGPGGEQQLLAFDAKSLGKLVTKLGRTAWACTVFNLQIQAEDGSSQTLRALVR